MMLDLVVNASNPRTWKQRQESPELEATLDPISKTPAKKNNSIAVMVRTPGSLHEPGSGLLIFNLLSKGGDARKV